VRKIFLFGLLHPDAMYYAIWGVNENRDGALSEEQGRRLFDLWRSLRRARIFLPNGVWSDVTEKVEAFVVTVVTVGVRSGAASNERSESVRLNQASDRS
jgi:hypothetical protein